MRLLALAFRAPHASAAVSSATTFSGRAAASLSVRPFRNTENRLCIWLNYIASDGYVANNVVEHINGDGLRLSGSNIVVENNTLYGWMNTNADHRDMLQVYAGSSNVSNIIIRNNKFFLLHPTRTYLFPGDCQVRSALVHEL